ncbi:MAG TPA: diaminopimelate epimerase [Candidatus Eremiobacteraceae bacterium]|nr:diaminopimelate epimerase [Candidatus Eremiobacteraceae bacterium]
MARISITKCQGTGNDFVLLDRRAGSELPYPDLAQTLCDRHVGIGADGLLVLERASNMGADLKMRIYNADGSQAEMCGNGVRCVARYMHDRTPTAPTRLKIETVSGTVRTEIAGSSQFSVRVDMGVPGEIREYGKVRTVGIAGDRVDVSMGNPHCVVFVDVDLMPVDLASAADAIAADGTYPDGVNVEIARIFSGGPLAMRVYERGVGETQACGTGACAVAIAAIELGRAESPVRVTMLGGDVTVEWAGAGENAFLTGGAELVFDTTIDVADEVVAVSP